MISFENLLDENCLKKSKEIYNILLELTQNNAPEKAFLGINYDLKEIFINLDQEEINAYIYKINKGKQLSQFDDLSDKVIEKLSLLLPQDILLFKKYSGFDKKYTRIAEKIIEEYNKGEHTNLRNFIEKMKNTKNVVYTFSNILDYIENLEIDKTIVGKISKESIKHLKISDFKSENEFEKQIDQFLDDKDKTICIIKFKPNEGNFMNYIKFFIKNKEKDSFMKNKNEQSEKAFIFIVHLSRINNLDLENLSKKSLKQQNNINKKKLNETISLLSEYDQTFIDLEII
jgi:hypothetical protein